jgi:hypothetical protein
LERWFIDEWRADRDENRAFREDVLERLTALETTNTVDAEHAAKSHTRVSTWVAVLISGAALLVSIIALV